MTGAGSRQGVDYILRHGRHFSINVEIFEANTACVNDGRLRAAALTAITKEGDVSRTRAEKGTLGLDPQINRELSSELAMRSCCSPMLFSLLITRSGSKFTLRASCHICRTRRAVRLESRLTSCRHFSAARACACVGCFPSTTVMLTRAKLCFT